MKVLVTGSNGQLGHDVIKSLESANIEFLGTDRDTLDITDREQVKLFVSKFNPDVIIHCAAYTAVDKAEEEKEKDVCYSVNVLGTRYLAEICSEINAKMVYISTDYVFDGEGDQPFTITDLPNPINYYGKTKYDGEIEVQHLLNCHFILRISWVFGQNGNNFVKTMLRIGAESNEVNVVGDQVGSPTYTIDVAEFILSLIQTDDYGIYHITNDGYCSWYEFAKEIFKQAGIDIKVNCITSENYHTRARRPKNSRLLKNSGIRLRTWQEAITHFLSHMN